MRTCPKEEETVETCDGMNQKNLIFEEYDLKKAEKSWKELKKAEKSWKKLKNEKNYKNRKVKDERNSNKKKLIFLSRFLAYIDFPCFLGD